MKDILLRMCPNYLHRFYSDLKFWMMFHLARKCLVSEMFQGLMTYDINWDNPQDLNEKINWMKLYYDTSLWTPLADKYLVRNYVSKRIGEQHLPKIYGTWQKAENIDFAKLPDKFVLKTNHGAGMEILVSDKNSIDKQQICKTLDNWLKIRYGYHTIEPHYLGIKPLIFAEEYFESNVNYSSSLVDYKVFCLSGKAYCILVCTDREIGGGTKLSFYDCNWHPIENILAGPHKDDIVPVIPKPNCLSQLIEYAEILAQGHPQVRVDFYIVDDKIYFGEMTFTSQGGYMNYISRDYSLRMGNLVDLNL